MQKWVVLLFQFHNGTIKTMSQIKLPQIKLRFNSITVQLRRNGQGTAGQAPSFQFHNGTIKTQTKAIAENLAIAVSIP